MTLLSGQRTLNDPTGAKGTFVLQDVGLGTVTANDTPDSAGGFGLVLTKASAANVSNCATVAWKVGTDRLWCIAMDTLNREMVTLYDFDLTDDETFSSSGDVWRWAHGAIAILGPGVGSPAGSGWRLQITSDGAADLATNGLIKLTSHANYRAGNGVGNFLLGHDDTIGADVFNITTAGKAAFGTTTADAFSGNVYLTVKRGLGVWDNGNGDSFIGLNQAGGSIPKTYLIGTELNSGAFYIKDNGAGTYPVYLAEGTPNGSLQGGNGYIWLGASSSKVGFFGNTGAVKQTVTGSRGGNAALASLLTALAAHNLVTDSSSA